MNMNNKLSSGEDPFLKAQLGLQHHGFSKHPYMSVIIFVNSPSK